MCNKTFQMHKTLWLLFISIMQVIILCLLVYFYESCFFWFIILQDEHCSKILLFNCILNSSLPAKHITCYNWAFIYFLFLCFPSLSVTRASWSMFPLLLLLDLFHSRVLSIFLFLAFSSQSSVFFSLLIAVVLDGFSLITLLPLCLGGSQAVLRCGVKACAKLAFHLCPKKRWWGLGVFSVVIPTPLFPPALYVPQMTMSLTNQITA